jgi:predicted secreted protein
MIPDIKQMAKIIPIIFETSESIMMQLRYNSSEETKQRVLLGELMQEVDRKFSILREDINKKVESQYNTFFENSSRMDTTLDRMLTLLQMNDKKLILILITKIENSTNCQYYRQNNEHFRNTE